MIDSERARRHCAFERVAQGHIGTAANVVRVDEVAADAVDFALIGRDGFERLRTLSERGAGDVPAFVRAFFEIFKDDIGQHAGRGGFNDRGGLNDFAGGEQIIADAVERGAHGCDDFF